MAKLAKATRKGFDALNRAGAPAFGLGLKERLATRLVTNLIAEPKFYGDTTQELVDEVKLVVEADPLWALQAAVYARREMYLRTSPLILLRYLAQSPLPSDIMAQAVQAVCTRPDQLVGLFTYYQNTQEKRTLDHGLKRGIALALESYSPYQLAKYKAGLSKLIRITHPTPKPEFKALIEGTLTPPVTWEVEISKHGNRPEIWDMLLVEDKLPYMALLRNLRNMVAAGATRLDIVANRLADPERVRRSKQLPFRFLSAYNTLPTNTPQAIRDAVDEAFTLSADNLPRFGGVTVLVADESGSMTSPVSRNGSISLKEIANTLLALGGSMSEAAIPIVFADRAAIVELTEGRHDLAAVQQLSNVKIGGGTNLTSAFDLLSARGVRADRVIVFSDMQSWADHTIGNSAQLAAAQWRAQYSPGAWIHSVDLAGYGTAQIKGDRVSLLAGWSDRLLEAVQLAEQGLGGIVERISSYAWQGHAVALPSGHSEAEENEEEHPNGT